MWLVYLFFPCNLDDDHGWVGPEVRRDPGPWSSLGRSENAIFPIIKFLVKSAGLQVTPRPSMGFGCHGIRLAGISCTARIRGR